MFAGFGVCAVRQLLTTSGENPLQDSEVDAILKMADPEQVSEPEGAPSPPAVACAWRPAWWRHAPLTQPPAHHADGRAAPWGGWRGCLRVMVGLRGLGDAQAFHALVSRGAPQTGRINASLFAALYVPFRVERIPGSHIEHGAPVIGLAD